MNRDFAHDSLQVCKVYSVALMPGFSWLVIAIRKIIALLCKLQACPSLFHTFRLPLGFEQENGVGAVFLQEGYSIYQPRRGTLMKIITFGMKSNVGVIRDLLAAYC
jgi:hypothetical protein